MLYPNCYNHILTAGRKNYPVVFLYNPTDSHYPWRLVCRSHWSKEFHALTPAFDYAVERGWIGEDERGDIIGKVSKTLELEMALSGIS